MGVQEISLFEFMYDKFTPKKIRLYQFFAGIGSQAKSLKNLGVEFEDYKIVEWAVPSIKAYNLIHTKDFTDYSKGKIREEMVEVVKNVSLDYNKPISKQQLDKKSDEWIKDIYNNIIATHNLVDISSVKGKDLEIDTNYTNVIFYSFPCQDLSKAGLKFGLKKDSGTRSGLLWEVERILTELNERERESCVLICENVPDLVEVNFVRDFSKWVMALEKLGFSSYDEILNSKDYCVPQNRKRVFMVSLPGKYHYVFPRKMPFEFKLKDFLETNPDKKYYLSEKMLQGMINTKFHQYQLENRLQDEESVVDTLTTATGNRCPHLIPIKNNNSKGYELATDGDAVDISGRMQYHRGTVQKGITQTITTMGGNDVGVCVNEVRLVGGIGEKKSNSGTQYYEQNRIYDANGVATAIPTSFHPYYLSELKIRKLTPKECLRLMGFEDDDYNSLKDTLTDSQIYHVAGDSIVVTVLMGIFGTLLGVEDYERKIKDYANELATSK